jgi:hypothetical protein
VGLVVMDVRVRVVARGSEHEDGRREGEGCGHTVGGCRT